MENVNPGSLRVWLLLPRFHFIPLTVILVSLGTAIAAYEGSIHCGYFGLALVGSILVHVTVNDMSGLTPVLGRPWSFHSGKA